MALRGVSFTYEATGEERSGGGEVRVLERVDLVLERGWYGLVGENGSGKSTLLRLLAGELEPSAGRIELEGQVLRVPQDASAPTDEVMGLASDDGGEARRLRSVLGLEPSMVARWDVDGEGLSAGERRKWLVGAALWSRPEILLLDEPETHLDQRGRERLTEALGSFGGLGIIVAHDRELLDAVAPKTLWLEDGALRVFAGGVSAAMRALEDERRARLHRREVLRGVVDERLRQRERAKREAAKASAGESTRKRMKDKNDSDARGVLKKNLANWAAGTHARRARLAADAVESARSELATARVEDRLGGPIAWDYEPCKRPHVLVFETQALEVPGRRLLSEVRVAVARDDRIHVAGDNGSGKSTLLRAMVEAAPIPADRILVVPQEVPTGVARESRREVLAMAPRDRGRVFQLVAALGTEPERIMASASMSLGEAKKLWLAVGLTKRPWLLVLDEPENHLDLASVERLAEALEGFPGAIVLVTHDRALADRVATTRWTLRDGVLTTEGIEGARSR